jgi:hypothetical protein
MALPTVNDVQAVDPVLQNMLVAYAQAETRFVALRAFPAMSVDKDSGTYYLFDKKYWFQDGLQERAPGSHFARAGFGVSTATYVTQQWAREFPIPDEVSANAQFDYDLARAGVEWLAQQSFIRKERAFAADFMVTGVWSTTNTTDTDWDDSGGVPVTNVRTAGRTISAATGYSPNKLIVGEIVYDALLVNAQIAGRLQYSTQMTMATVENVLAAVLGVDEILVSRGSYNSANEGQTASMAAIIDDDALLIYSAESANALTATAGKTFVWNPGGGAGAQSQYRDDTVDSTIVKHKEQWDQKVVAADLGYLWTDIV